MSRRKQMTAAAFAAVICCVSMDNAGAQGMSIEDYRRPNSQADLNFNKGYLTGVKDGLAASNMALDNKLFCLPGEIPILSFEQANDLLMSWARKKGPDVGGASVNRALLIALRERYPCRASGR